MELRPRPNAHLKGNTISYAQFERILSDRSQLDDITTAPGACLIGGWIRGSEDPKKSTQITGLVVQETVALARLACFQ
jgi:hypothetical protein